MAGMILQARDVRITFMDRVPRKHTVYLRELSRASVAVKARRPGLMICGRKLALLMLRDRAFRRAARHEVKRIGGPWHAELRKFLRYA